MTTRTSLADQPCSIARSLDLVGDPWSLLIVRDVLQGQRRFADLAASLPIARNVLAARLSGLVEAGVLEKVAYQDRPVRHAYRPTEAGRELIGTLMALAAWGDRWLVPDGEDVPVGFVHRGHDCTPLVACAACGDELAAEDLRLRPHLGQHLPTAARADR